MEDQRICIKFCVKNGFKGAEIFWMLQTAYGDAVMSRRRVFEWYKRFKDGREETADNERSGRTSTSTTPEKVDEVLELSDDLCSFLKEPNDGLQAAERAVEALSERVGNVRLKVSPSTRFKVIVAVYACGVDVEKGPIRQQLWNAPPCDNVESWFGAQSRMIPGDEDPDKTITTKIITSGDVVSELPESTLEDSPVIQKSEECRQQEMIQTGCVAEEGELIASDNGCGTSVVYKIKRTEGECPQGDIQSENSTPGILSEILHENSNDLGELQCDSVADFSDSVRLSGTTAAIQLDRTELDAPWKCDKARWSKHPEVGAGDPTERDRALDALWKSDDNVCDAEVARNVSAPSSAMQAEEMCQECVPIIFVPSPDKVQIKQPPPRKSSPDLETATGSDTSRRFKKFTALCVVGTKKPRFEGFGKREPLEKENVKPKEEKGGHEMNSADQVDESTVKIGDLQPRRGRKRRKRNTNYHNPLYIAATECSQGEFKISDESIVGSEIWPPSCGEPPPCARQRDQSMALALVESGKKARVEMWFCKQGLVLTLPLRFREADDPHVARDVREIKGPPISASGEISLFGTKRIEKGAVKRCSREIEEKTWGSQERRDICLLYKPSQDLEADIFTKDLSRDQMKKHLESLSIVGKKPNCVTNSALIGRWVLGLSIRPAAGHEDMKKADKLFDEAKYEQLNGFLLNHDPDDSEVLWRLARCSYEISKSLTDSAAKKAKIEEGFKFITQALELNKNNFAIHKWYAILLDGVSELKGTKERIERSMEVKEHLQKAVKINPEDATSYYVLGEWCYSFATLPWYQKKIASVIFATPPSSTLEEALGYYEKAEATSPLFYSMNLLKLGQVYNEMNRKDDAVQALLKLRSFKPITHDDREAIKQGEALLKKLGH
ncbi:RMDN1 [Cordylochernes scorpioides]|uniref:Regulator of microtubule dynamics protein 1 n=1 Tax=Cordylochernes scorpioides TaxID=51811 RepID=A0ABY6L971_9ARAC|nr:RMDN1 [Cordylochernes scorpioides]